MTKSHVVVSWLCQLVIAAILLQTLFFKFTAAEESVYIFTTIGAEPWGRIGSGVAELVASGLRPEEVAARLPGLDERERRLAPLAVLLLPVVEDPREPRSGRDAKLVEEQARLPELAPVFARGDVVATQHVAGPLEAYLDDGPVELHCQLDSRAVVQLGIEDGRRGNAGDLELANVVGVGRRPGRILLPSSIRRERFRRSARSRARLRIF